jgi:hypothetical protein
MLGIGIERPLTKLPRGVLRGAFETLLTCFFRASAAGIEVACLEMVEILGKTPANWS